MSKWFADSLIATGATSEGQVHVVHPGCNLTQCTTERIPSRDATIRLLFVGRDFIRKGGDLAVNAISILNSGSGKRFKLTIAGPKSLPDGILPNDNVVYVGDVRSENLPDLYARHDIFVLPTRFEAFGIAFIEALAHGLPCVGRNAFAMPEFLIAKKNAELISKDEEDPCVLAQAIYDLSQNVNIAQYAWEGRDAVREYYSWDRAAREMHTVIDASCGN